MQVIRIHLTIAIMVLMMLTVFPFGALAQVDDKWNLADSVKSAAALLKPLVVSVETRFDKPRTGYEYYEAMRGSRPLYGLYASGFMYKGKYVITVDDITDHLAYARVVTFDKKSYKAKLLGENSTFNVAVFEVDLPPNVVFPDAKFFDSDKIVLGMPICVVGKSLSGDDTFSTAGIISAIRKETVGSDVPTEEFLQFDANYEFTFSGAPLADVRGNILGMVVTTEGINLNLATPINDVLRAADKIIGGDKRVPWVGAELLERTVNIDIIYDLDCLPFDNGLFITYVEPNSPADLAGLESGDVIESIDGKFFDFMNEYTMIKRRFVIGQQVKIVFWRNCKKFEVMLTVLPTADSADDGSSVSTTSGKPPGHP